VRQTTGTLESVGPLLKVPNREEVMTTRALDRKLRLVIRERNELRDAGVVLAREIDGLRRRSSFEHLTDEKLQAIIRQAEAVLEARRS
jgi:hypothetical protein